MSITQFHVRFSAQEEVLCKDFDLVSSNGVHGCRRFRMSMHLIILSHVTPNVPERVLNKTI
jgi:hypothetical protein